MRYVLAPSNRGVLRQAARAKLLLAFDYDGTLAPIVADPASADMRATTRTLLTRLAERYPCVIISGRAHRDLLRRMKGVGVAEVVGNHGIEPWKATARAARAVRIWRPQIEARLSRLGGVMIEDKAYSIAINYRRAANKKAARIAARSAAATLDGVRLVAAKQGLSLVLASAPHKGMALVGALRRFGCDAALYVGDDETDEDVFALDQPERLVTIRVGRRRTSAASFYIRSQAEIDRLLRRLLALAPS